MADSKKYNGSTWEHSLRKLTTATDTIATLPADIYADGNNATVGISGNTVQNGTPTPTAPIQPSECGELEENVAIIDNRSDTITNSYYKDVRLSDELQAGTYTISFTMDSKTGDAYASSLGRGNTTTYQSDILNYTIDNTPANINRTITLNNNACIWARFLHSSTPATFSYSVSKIAIVSGDMPYGQYKIPILSANTITPIYLGEVQTTRRIKKLVFDGTENWAKFSNSNYTFEYHPSSRIINGLCSNYAKYYGGQFDKIDGIYLSNTNAFIITDLRFTTVDEFKSYLAAQYSAGTPVTVWYVLATPTTGIVNEPLRKIGNYADEVSGITIPTTAGADSFDVLTTLKPSEVTANYHGWHTGAVHERDSGQWD